MEYQVTVETIAAQALVVSRRRTTLRLVSREIQGFLSPVWNFLRQHPGVRTDGHNVAVYLGGSPESPVEVGVQVATPFEETAEVVRSATPAGIVATAAHFGPYTELRAAHTAIVAWCRQHGHEIAGPFWEVYGDHDDDPAKLRTDIYYRLKAGTVPVVA